VEASYSYLSADIGEMRAARSAGIRQAASATAVNTDRVRHRDRQQQGGISYQLATAQ